MQQVQPKFTDVPLASPGSKYPMKLKQHISSLQREPDMKSLPPLPASKWPSYMKPASAADEQAVVKGLANFHRTMDAGYAQSHTYDFLFPSMDLKMDELAQSNRYMKLIFGGEPDPATDNIDLAYNNSIRQMAEAPVDQDTLLGNEDPRKFIPAKESTVDDLIQTFGEAREFYKGALDSDANRFLKTRVTHRMMDFTYYDKRAQRYDHVHGQNNLLNRPTGLENFHPWENLSSRTYAPDGSGGEVPLNIENTNGMDPRSVHIPDINPKHVAPKTVPEAYNFTDIGNYAGREVDRHLYSFPDENPSFVAQFRNLKSPG